MHDLSSEPVFIKISPTEFHAFGQNFYWFLFMHGLTIDKKNANGNEWNRIYWYWVKPTWLWSFQMQAIQNNYHQSDWLNGRGIVRGAAANKVVQSSWSILLNVAMVLAATTSAGRRFHIAATHSTHSTIGSTGTNQAMVGVNRYSNFPPTKSRCLFVCLKEPLWFGQSIYCLLKELIRTRTASTSYIIVIFLL